MFSTQHSADADDLTLMLSIPYLVWLKMAAAAPHDPDARLRQFVLARKRGLVPADYPEPIVVSSFHPL